MEADVRVERAISQACEEFGSWLATLKPWTNPPWVGESKGYRGPTLLGEADCRLHLVRLIARVIDPAWIHQEVPTSEYLFPSADVPRSWRLDIGIVDPERLSPTLTAADMRSLRWNAFIEVKFRGSSPGWEFAAGGVSAIAADLRKLQRVAAFCDQAYAVVIEEMPSLSETEVHDLRSIAPNIELRFVRAPIGTGVEADQPS